VTSSCAPASAGATRWPVLRGARARRAVGALVGLQCALAVVALAGCGTGVAAAAFVQRFAISDVSAESIAAGPDGNLWLAEQGAITRMTPAGAVTRFEIDASGGFLELAAGPDGNVWFTDFNANGVGRITPSGKVTRFSAGIPPHSGPSQIAAGPDGNLWFTEPTRGWVARITPTGRVTQFSAGIPPHSGLSGIGAGPDGNVWFGVRAGQISVARVTPGGDVTLFSSGLHADAPPRALAAGPDGNVWFTEDDIDSIGRITPSGKITEFHLGISPDAEPTGIVAGPDGNLWFTEFEGGRLGRITPTGTVTEFSAGLPSGMFLSAITAGPGASLWFPMLAGVGRLTPTPGTRVSVLTRRARVSPRGATTVELACGTGTETCSGKLELTIRVTHRERGVQPFRTTAVLARARFGLSPGRRTTVRLALNAIGRRHLTRAKGRRLTTRFRAAGSAGDEQGTLTLTATRHVLRNRRGR